MALETPDGLQVGKWLYNMAWHHALLDKGSSISLLGDKFKSVISQKEGFEAKTHSLQLASGQAAAKGKVSLQVRRAGGQSVQQFVWLPGLCSTVILGRDFISRNDISIHLTLKGWTRGIETQEVIPFERVRPAACCNVVIGTPAVDIDSVCDSAVCAPKVAGTLHRLLERHQYIFSTKPVNSREFSKRMQSPPFNLAEYFPDEELPDLVTEVRPAETVVPGRRLVDMANVLVQLKRLASHSQYCMAGDFQLVGELRDGMKSTLEYLCSSCGRCEPVTTDKAPSKEVNDSMVWGAVSIGIGHYQAQETFACLEVPTMAKNKWNKHAQHVANAWEDKLDGYMRTNGAREKAIAIEKGHIEYGIPYITVIVDGGCSKRLYGHAYNASSGVACIIGADTNDLLYMGGVCNKYCYPCARAVTLKTPAKAHRCYKNYTGTSTGMEQTIIMRGFRASEEMHGVSFKYMIGDGDSSIYASVQQSVRYGRKVIKLECANHIVRGYTDKLYKMMVNTSLPFSARKELTSVIPRLTKAARGAITSAGNSPENVDQLRKDLRNGPYHVFGDHSKCLEETISSTGSRVGYCSHKNLLEENKVPFMKKTPVWAGILKALEPIVT